MNQDFLKKILFLVAGIVVGIGFISSTAYAATPTISSARVTGPNTVTVTYSEAVNTTLNDYGNFTGSLAGRSLTGVSGSGTNVITLTFDGSPLSADATGGITINSAVTSISDGSTLGGGPYSITDGQSPFLSSISMTSNLANGTMARTGDTLTVSFNTNEAIYSPTMTIDNNSVAIGGGGSGPYSGGYTLSSSDTPDNVPVTIRFTDIAGNQGYGSFTLGGGIGPKIVSITSDANTTGSLITGNNIDFVLTLATPAPGAFVSGSYNGVPLSWITNNGGATYIATYSVQSGNPSTYSPLQITGVTVRDSAGNVSSPGYGSDIQKIINAQSFAITETTPIPSVTTVNNPRYTFFSAQEGTITFGGDCTSINKTATLGYNYITFDPLPNGLHSNCTVTVVDQGGYASNMLTLAPFTVEVGNNTYVAPTLPATGTVSSYKFYNALNLGSTGADVTALQQRLTAEDVYSGPITGYYGALTQTAVKKYQGLHGLTQLGNVGPGTRSALNSGL